MRADLAAALMMRHRAVMLRYALRQVDDPDDRPLVDRILNTVAHEPLPADREPLRALLRRPWPGGWDRAIRGLEALGEDDAGHRDILRSVLRHGPWSAQLRAASALGMRGDPEARQFLVEAAGRAGDPIPRSEALRALGSLPDAARHIPLFEHALLHDHDRGDDGSFRTPAAMQAALALGQLGGPDVAAMLLQGYLRSRDGDASNMFEAALITLIEEAEGGATRTVTERRALIIKRDFHNIYRGGLLVV